jgi:hypothetical protein
MGLMKQEAKKWRQIEGGWEAFLMKLIRRGRGGGRPKMALIYLFILFMNE